MWNPARTSAPRLEVASFARALDTGWRRTSYSALTSAAHDQAQRLGSEPEVAQKDDETDLEELTSEAPVDDGLLGLRAIASAWDELPGGPEFGTLVHTVFEELVDPADDAAVREVVTQQVARYAPGTDVTVLTDGVLAALATPLGDLTDAAALRDIPAADRLRELDFELPLAGGDEARSSVGLNDVGLKDLVPLWRAHCPTGQLSTYADVLAELQDVPLRGYLTGSIDVVLRVGAPDARRYVVVDYKTNRLGGYDEPLTAWHYRSSALETAMVEAHYPLQAVLYAVALHRYLRWRQPAYDPDVHLGGVLYLFLRGMSGPGVVDADGSAPGVFSWRPPTGLVTGLSDLLAGSA
jgi:exodeoxyribonuclease V beta subunit